MIIILEESQNQMKYMKYRNNKQQGTIGNTLTMVFLGMVLMWTLMTFTTLVRDVSAMDFSQPFVETAYATQEHQSTNAIRSEQLHEQGLQDLWEVFENNIYIFDDITPTLISATYVIEPIVEEIEEPTPIRVYLDIPLSIEIQDYTMDLAYEFGVPYDLLFAMMFRESTFRPHIISQTNDYGIMQINRVNHGWLRTYWGITDFLDVRQNILAGTVMISELVHEFECFHLALMAYNHGRAGARRHWNNGTTTSTFSRRVMQTMEEYIQQRQDIINAMNEI